MRGLYKIKNLVNGKAYIGSSNKNTTGRLIQHKSDLKANRHFNEHLQRAWNKYGEESFTFEHLLDFDGPYEYLIEEETKAIQNLGKNTYNILKEVLPAPALSPEVQQKIKDKWQTEEYRQKVVDGNKKAWSDPERLKEQSEKSKKLWENPEYRKVISEKRKAQRAREEANMTTEQKEIRRMKMIELNRKRWAGRPRKVAP
jgi:group I intron endonuclease